LHDAGGDLIGMRLLLVRVLQELRCNTLRIDARGHEVMALIAQYTDGLSCERLVEQIHHGLSVGAVAGCHRALFDVLPGAFPQGLDVCKKRFFNHSYPSQG
jgi:hypothetical protein